jgi:AcrR family transcriptional regulator
MFGRVGLLAGIESPRGLPRGRGSLPPEEVARAHRERLMRAMIGAAAELGYANVRIVDVVDRARVSKQAFYQQFPGKQECFLAACAEGARVILDQFSASAASHDPEPRAQIRDAIHAYFALAREEPEFSHCMLIELQAIGPAGLLARQTAHRQIAALLAAWHQHRRERNPNWPQIPPSRYAAAVGAVHDLLFDTVAGKRLEDTAALEDDAVDAITALLQIPAA